jgi:MFS family permease
MPRLLQARDWPALGGYVLFVAMVAAGYYYNLTFVQLGLEDFGTRVLGLSSAAVARDMALLALLTCVVAISFGWYMQQLGWGRRFRLKLRLALAVVLAQTALTLICPLLQTEAAFLAWLAGVSLALGVGVPAMFSLTVDLVPVRARGEAAALITAIAYAAANVLPPAWTFEVFRSQALLMLLAGVVGVGVLAFLRHPWLEQLADQHRRPEYGLGRFLRPASGDAPRLRRRMASLIAVMFGIYFVDSLGFLRLLKTPIYMESAWQSGDFDVRLFIAGVHVVGALIAGVLYPALRPRGLFLWIFGVFALAHLQYGFHIRLESINAVLAMPMLYALAVSLYTVVNFAVWADISTPDTIPLNSALGVALSGWTATFLSTALAIRWGEQMPLAQHIQIVDALAMLCFVALLLVVFFSPARPAKRSILL